MKLGLFGGTFDPIHIGHFNLAKALIDKKYLDRIIFIPAAKSPFKLDMPVTAFKHRYRMVEFAIGGLEYFSVSDIEEKRLPLVSYTFDTVNEFKKLYPNNTLYWIIGEDSLLQIHTWHRGRELVKLCEILTFPRPNENCTIEKLVPIWGKEEAKRLFCSKIDLPLFDVSSTQIRQALKAGKDESSVIPMKVLNYIEEHHLYRDQSS